MKLNGPLTVRGYSISQVKLQPHNTQLRVYERAILYRNDIIGLCGSDEWATDDKLGKNIAIYEMKLNIISLVYIVLDFISAKTGNSFKICGCL